MMKNGVSYKNNDNTVIFELKENILTICNNGKPFSIEGIESLMLPYYTSKSKREFKQSFKSSKINDQVEELIEKRRDNYLREPERIQSDYKIEYETVGEYHGREILELLQNCIDAMPGNGSFLIGSKGLGFRSLLNWCESIKIYSGELSVAFGLEEAVKFKNSLGLNQKVAILSAPCIIEPIELEYTTQIVLNLKKSVISDVKNQLSKIDEKSMVFLPKIEELTIKDVESLRTFQKLDDPNGDVLVIANIDGISAEYFWRVFKQEQRVVTFSDIHNNEKEYCYGISIAFCEELSSVKNNCLYSYFKTKVELPIGWLCHADFELRSDRNDLIEHPLNWLILKELISLIDRSSEKIVQYISNSESAITSIVPNNSLPANIAGFEFSEYFYSNIGRSCILPTNNGRFISISDSPWLANEKYPKSFIGDDFTKLLKYFENDKIREFIRTIAKRDGMNVDIPIVEIQELINKASYRWSMDDFFTVFEWWRKTYASQTDALKYLPNLLKLENGNWATGKDKVFFKIGAVPPVPSWVKFSFLSEEFQKAAISFYKEEESYLEFKSRRSEIRDVRVISEYVKIGNTTIFRYLDRNTTIAQVNMSVGENWNYACELVDWLYSNYGSDTEWRPPTEITFNFPAKNRVIRNPGVLYFGEYYNNNLAPILSIQKKLNELFDFHLTSEEKERFVSFVSKFGVRSTPAQEPVMFAGKQIPESYKEALYENFRYPLQLDGATAIIDMRKEGTLESINVDSYINLENILNKADTSDIINWIEKDTFLKNSLMNRCETKIENPIKAKRRGQINNRSIPRSQVRNYIAHTFSVTKWIQLNGKRYAPNQIIFDEKLEMQLIPHLIGVSFNSLFGNITIEEYEINAIIDNLGFIKDFSKIKSSILYEILNELSVDGVDTSGEISRKIYNQIMKASGLKEPNKLCAERDKFLRSGKLFCFDNQFHDVNKVYYADKSFPKRVMENSYLINLRKNQGVHKAELWFGVKEFIPNIVADEYTKSVFNEQFEADFHELLKGLYIENHYITDLNRWNSIKKMRIILASNMTISYGKYKQSCEIYQYAKDSNEHYVVMIGNEKPDNFDERLTNVLYEIVKTVINIEENALGSSFRDLRKFPCGKLRKALILRNEDDNIWQEADNFFDGIIKPVVVDDKVARNRELFIKCRENNFEKFKRILYQKLRNATIDEQKTYLSEIDKYNRIIPRQELLNDDHCNVLFLLKSIEPANLLLEDDIEVDVEEIGKHTYQLLKDMFSQYINELNVFLSKEYDSLLRFGNDDFLISEFTSHLEKRRIIKDENLAAPIILPTPIVVDSTQSQLSPLMPNASLGDNVSSGGTPYTNYVSRQEHNIAIGKLAEKIVYAHLINLYGNENVKWVSQYAREENENLDGSDRNCYDIEYIIGDIKFYVEVKTNSSTLPIISFNLTNGERTFAEKNKHYKVYVVSNPKSKVPSISFFTWDKIKAFVDTPNGYLVEFKQNLVPNHDEKQG